MAPTILLAALLMTGCSSDEDSTIQKQMEDKGHEAATEIKTTIQKAEMAGQIQNAHNKALEDAAKE